MPMRHAQRKHIIQSLTSLLYQLHTVSFLLSPRFWPYLCRLSTQFQFSRPRELDSQRSLRFWFILIVLVNMQCFHQDIFNGAAEGKSIVLDFVGAGYKPSKAFLLSLDFAILVLECILTTVAYETSFTLAMPPGTSDPLQLESPHTASASPPPIGGPSTKPLDSTSCENETEYIIDLRLRPLLQRLRHPPSPPPPAERNLSEELLPLPNTTQFQLSRTMGMLARARAEFRERMGRANEVVGTDRAGADRERSREAEAGSDGAELRRIPGGLGGDEEL